MAKSSFSFYLVVFVALALFIHLVPRESLTDFKNAFGDALVAILSPHR